MRKSHLLGKHKFTAGFFVHLIKTEMKTEFFIVAVCCYITLTAAICPSTQLLLPCTCVEDVIFCGGNMYYDLKQVFVSISSGLTETEKHFKEFYFNNTVINELVINVFYDITFDSIKIWYAYNLSKINPFVFISTNFYVKYFAIVHTPYGNNITSDNIIYNAINSMVNVERVEIVNTSITSIPSNAFTILTKLKTLNIYDNLLLKSIGNNAFYELNNLTQLYLRRNSFENIPDHAFNFRYKSTNTLLLYLHYISNLNSNSFSIGVFTNIKRPFLLWLEGDTDFKYLDENIFNPALAIGNQIYLTYTRLECDCKMYWLYQNRIEYEKLVHDANCTDGYSVFTAREKYNACDVL